MKNSLKKKLIDELKNNQITIYLFHGVIYRNTNSIRNYTGKHIESNHFYNLMKQLSKKGNPISIDEAVETIKGKKKIKPKSFVITFDDGFYNNISVGYPLLKSLKIPFTIYLTTSFIDKNYMSWIDQIEYCVQKTRIKEIFILRYKKNFEINNDAEKIKLMNFIRLKVKKDKNCDPNKFAKQVNKSLGFNKEIKSNSIIDKKLSWKLISKFKNDKLVTFGGHSHTHLTLSYLSPDILKKEIKTSVQKIKNHLKLKKIHYSYPEGSKQTYSKKVIRELKKNDVISSVTTIKGSNAKNTNLYELKRIFVA